MQSWPTAQGRNLRYAIIGRLKIGHETYGLHPDQIREIIADELIGHINESDVLYVPPNFIICLDNPVAQEGILFHPTMETNSFQLQMLPWSKEHELAQLPWITVCPSAASTIEIDPLTILPIASKTKHRIADAIGIQKLKDTFAATIPDNYDLRAPDFSYLLITELRAFYEKKFAIFMEAKQIAAAIYGIMHDSISDAAQDIADLTKQMTVLCGPTNSDTMQMRRAFLDDLSNALTSTHVYLPHLYEVADSALNHMDTPLNLEGFKQGPPTIETAVPPTYADRLKVIYTTAIQKIYQTTPIIETIKREENRYETYVTIDNFTRRYFGEHTRNAPAMEAAAIYYGLKYLTNVQGYRIIDLNYPVLKKLVTDVDAWNARINIFQLFSQIGFKEIERVYKSIASKCLPAELSKLKINTLEPAAKAVQVLTQRLDRYNDSIADLCHNLDTNQEMYDRTRLATYSPTRSYYHWGRAVRPTVAEMSAD